MKDINFQDGWGWTNTDETDNNGHQETGRSAGFASTSERVSRAEHSLVQQFARILAEFGQFHGDAERRRRVRGRRGWRRGRWGRGVNGGWERGFCGYYFNGKTTEGVRHPTGPKLRPPDQENTPETGATKISGKAQFILTDWDTDLREERTFPKGSRFRIPGHIWIRVNEVYQ